ncbi:TonB system transport protein ExbD [Marinibacterium sp. SX1]|uniref:TonB system transport protein ExbD n=1 Tax=Marinibacterium sp. SX1 TaxID=3388424 RepID=UPI003D172551
MAGGIRERGGDDLAENAEINVTPFIDVMLVLLIIFMVAAPLSTVDVAVDLPGSTAKPAERPQEPLYLTLQTDLSLHLGEADVTRASLGSEIDRITEGDRDTRIFMRADKTVDYGDLMEVMNLLRAAGYLKIAFVGLEQVPQGDGAATSAAGGASSGGSSGASPDE